jgi:YtkA-like
MRRKLLVLALGFGFLVAVGWFGGVMSDAVSHVPTAPVQTAQAGPYQITLQVDPNPPSETQPATISIQVANASHQAVSDAHVFIDSTMEAMDMGTTRNEAHAQGNGLYRAQVQFAMGGPWGLRVSIDRPGQKNISTTFQVTAQ